MGDTGKEIDELLQRMQESKRRNTPAYVAEARRRAAQAAEQEVARRTEALVAAVSDHTAAAMDTLPAAHSADPAPLSFELWEALAYDLAIDHASEDTLAKAYGVTVDAITALRGNPYFSKMLAAKKAEVRELGADAAFTVKMRLMVNKAAPRMLTRLMSSNTSNRDFQALFKTAVELAKLDPSIPSDLPAATAAAIGITFNITGVPDLGHLSVSTASPSTAPVPSVIDGEYETKGEVSTPTDTDDCELARL